MGKLKNKITTQCIANIAVLYSHKFLLGSRVRRRSREADEVCVNIHRCYVVNDYSDTKTIMTRVEYILEGCCLACAPAP